MPSKDAVPTAQRRDRIVHSSFGILERGSNCRSRCPRRNSPVSTVSASSSSTRPVGETRLRQLLLRSQLGLFCQLPCRALTIDEMAVRSPPLRARAAAKSEHAQLRQPRAEALDRERLLQRIELTYTAGTSSSVREQAKWLRADNSDRDLEQTCRGLR